MSVSRWNYRLTYPNYVGGIIAMQPDTFINIGGFSNSFWGWGGEDDDMANRLRIKKLFISRYPANIARWQDT